jgi:molybdopterin biosynthesis enzyme
MPPGSIYNSNRFFLRALLQRMGCVVTDFGIVPTGAKPLWMLCARRPARMT